MMKHLTEGRICPEMSYPSIGEEEKTAANLALYDDPGIIRCQREMCFKFVTCWAKEIEQLYRYDLKKEAEEMEAELRRLVGD